MLAKIQSSNNLDKYGYISYLFSNPPKDGTQMQLIYWQENWQLLFLLQSKLIHLLHVAVSKRRGD